MSQFPDLKGQVQLIQVIYSMVLTREKHFNQPQITIFALQSISLVLVRFENSNLQHRFQNIEGRKPKYLVNNKISST